MPDPNPKRGTYQVNMQPVGRRANIPAGKTLLDAAQSAGVELMSICGGVGACNSCKVRLMSGELTPPTAAEEAEFSPDELAEGVRLACQAYPLSDVKIDIPPESLTTPQRLQVEGQFEDMQPSPAVIGVDIHIDPPSLSDLRSDSERLRTVLAHAAGIPRVRIEYPVLATLSNKIRSLGWSTRAALRGDSLIALLPGKGEASQGTPLVGLAVDIGTTKLAAFLVDLNSGKTLFKTGAMNPQIAFGEDVISRIAYANKFEDDAHTHQPGEGRRILQGRLVETLNGMIAEMLAESQHKGAPVERDQIVDAVVVGNTAMHHLFAGFPVHQLGTAPYVPAVGEAVQIPARELGLELAPGANVFLPPNVAGYVGADHASMLLATIFSQFYGAVQAGQVVLALDIGTNTEITLAARGELISCSCASGPAFEGAHIRDGMRAAPGAIERVQISGGKVRIKTIGDQPPVGICGSGILDSVSEMIQAGILDGRGAFIQGQSQVKLAERQAEFLLVPGETTGHGRDLVVTRKDVNEIQLAKAAIRAGIQILLDEAGIHAEQIDQFVVAGAFGTYIDLGSAIQVGMFPRLPIERFHQVGNAAGAGARQMLISTPRRQLAEDVVNKIKYVELSNHPNFTTEFSKALFFPSKE